MKRFSKLISAVLCLCMIVSMIPVSFTASADASTVYVSNRYGSDSNDGLTADKAFKTIKKAVNTIGTANDGTV